MFGAARITVWKSLRTFDANIQLSMGSSAANTVSVAVMNCKMEWSKEDQIKLIDTYKQKNSDRGPENPHHFNNSRKQDAWEDIGAEMDRDVKERKEKSGEFTVSLKKREK
ncbi:hypothetical protein PR048_018119 [Dryococelus australis]|uniref:MADF domain-containing protein n=1 Tax=Dryococelus australis TaxID=614101 RepID=A0ABQ9HC02_9NEOP|nr:hypothetical protein PR048_018119 [Dryococelus australis]